MNLDRLSKISTVVIATIVTVGFMGFVYSEILEPYGQKLYREWSYRKQLDAVENDRKENALLYNCFAEADKAKSERIDWGNGCDQDSENTGGGILPDCYWDNSVVNNKAWEADRKACESQFPKK